MSHLCNFFQTGKGKVNILQTLLRLALPHLQHQGLNWLDVFVYMWISSNVLPQIMLETLPLGETSLGTDASERTEQLLLDILSLYGFCFQGTFLHHILSDIFRKQDTNNQNHQLRLLFFPVYPQLKNTSQLCKEKWSYPNFRHVHFIPFFPCQKKKRFPCRDTCHWRLGGSLKSQHRDVSANDAARHYFVDPWPTATGGFGWVRPRWGSGKMNYFIESAGFSDIV